MATTDRTSAQAHADALAGQIREASFAHLLVRADGASLAAAGLLAGACVETETPYQASVVRTRRDLDARTGAADESTTTIAIGIPDAGDAGADGLTEQPSVTAFEAADALGAEPDAALALAGVVADGETPEAVAPSIVEAGKFERRPGLSAPVTDPTDALTHTTLAHVAYSGDREATEATVADLDDATDRRFASLLAIDAVSADGATERAAEAIERAIHPLAGGPLYTIDGYADVLGALAETTPGRAFALALGSDPSPALDAWREHATAVHDAVRSAEMDQWDGLLVVNTDGPVEAVARLLRDFRSPEPAVLAIGQAEDEARGSTAEAALATVDTSAEAIETAAEVVDGTGLARATSGYARFDADREDAFVDAAMEAL